MLQEPVHVQVSFRDDRSCKPANPSWRYRSSRPHRLRRPTPQTVIEEIERLRRQRWTGKQIAAQVGVSPATVSRVLRRLGLNKLNALEPAEPDPALSARKPG
jgi:hypothetical protein